MLDWNKFAELPGDSRINFERLCRSIVRLHFSGVGQFSALKNQPGVEFHLKLKQTHEALGEEMRWYGWQCKWFERTQTGDLRAASKREIQESLEKTHEYIPDITDWVLWTPYTLSRKDQNWFNALNSHYNLHLWTDEEVNTYLGGSAAYLRSTFFGELILTPEELAVRHSEAIQPIKSRWIEGAHQSVDAERQIREMLGEASAWREISSISENLQQTAEMIKTSLPDSLSLKSVPFLSACTRLYEMLSEFHGGLESGCLESTLEKLDALAKVVDKDVALFPRYLRNLNIPESLQVTNALDDMYVAQEQLSQAKEILTTSMIAVLADAGGGKTQMAAQLTAQQANRSAGILFRGKNLKKGETLDDLCKHYHIDGQPVTSIENLLRALDSAAIRSGCRLPLVIDGLNEAEEPRDWHDLLSSLGITIKRYPNVLVVCTLRTGERRRDDYYPYQQHESDNRKSFVEISLPKDVAVIEVDGFGEDTEEAVEKYFNYYRIIVRDHEIALDIFRHPLNLRIFCETTNPKRETVIQIDHAPASLTLLFENYLDNICKRISQMNLVTSYSREQVSIALYHLGVCLWNGGSRDISEATYKQAIDGAHTLNWDSSLINLFSEEGVIFRNPGNEYGEYVLSPVYDLLGGYIIADALIKKYQHHNFFENINNPVFLGGFFGENNHHLAVDVFRSLVSLIPHRMNGVHWWPHISDDLEGTALFYTTYVDAKYIDEETVKAIKNRFLVSQKAQEQYFPQLQKFRGAINHPLNAKFFDDLLNNISVSERDLSWTEWLRKKNDLIRSSNSVLQELEMFELGWKEKLDVRIEVDYLKLIWVKWYLTSTNHYLRDTATRVIYWFGRGNAKALFEESIRSLQTNDPYVPERMLAASYGVAMALHTEQLNTIFRVEILPTYARLLYDLVFSDNSPHKTSHILICEYASRTIELAIRYNENLFSDDEISRSKFPFQHCSRESWGDSLIEATEYGYYETPFRMDFSNYTIGRLIPERRNYDFENIEYKHVRSQILWRVKDLGWTHEAYGKVDKEIPNSQQYFRGMAEKHKIDRYGKKYSWIAYYEMAGMIYPFNSMEYYGEGRHSLIDIDPSFPEQPENYQLFEVNLLGNTDQDDEEWVEVGDQSLVLDSLLSISNVAESPHQWVVLDGFITQREKTIHRDSFCFIRSFLVPNDKLTDLLNHLKQQNIDESNWRFPDAPSLNLVFAGEVGWCSTHPEINPIEMSFAVGSETYEAEVPKFEYYLDGELIENGHRLMFYMSPGDLLRTKSGIIIKEEDKERIETRISIVTKQQERDVNITFQVFSPVCGISCTLDTASHDAENHITLSRDLIDYFGIYTKPQSYDLFDANGKKVTFNISEHYNDFNNRRHMFLMREDVLKKYLNEKGYTLLWGIWGERNLLSVGDLGVRKYKVFRQITTMQNPQSIS